MAFLQGNIYVHQAATIIQDPVIAYSNLEPREMLIQEEYWYSTRNSFGELNIDGKEIVFLICCSR